MSTLKKRLRGLTCIWLALLLVLSVFGFGASAATPEKLLFYLGKTELSKEIDIRYINDDTIGKFEVDPDLPLNEMADLDKITEGVGGDLSGWKLWHVIGSGDLDTAPLKVAPDVVLNDISEKSFEDAFEHYNPEYFDLRDLFIAPTYDMKYWFTRQPTAAFPSVETNKPAESLQWFVPVFEELAVVYEDPQEGELAISGHYKGSYDTASGLWRSELTTYSGNALDINMDLKTGETVTVTLPADFDGRVYQSGTFKPLEKNGNAYTFTASYDVGSFGLIADGASKEFTATVKVNKVKSWKPEAGQTSATYSGESDMIYCVASFESGKYRSRSNTAFLGEYFISRQPTPENPKVEVNQPSGVKEYQWYSYEDVSGKFTFAPEITDPYKQLLLHPADLDFLAVFDPNELFALTEGKCFGEYLSNGVWAPRLMYEDSDRYDLSILLPLKQGGKLTVEVTSGRTAGEYDLRVLPVTREAMNNNTLSPIEPDSTGTYIIPDKAEFLFINLTANVDGYTAKPVFDTTSEVLKKVDGQNTDTLSGLSGSFVVKATMDDGTLLTSDPVTIHKDEEDDNSESGSGNEGDNTGSGSGNEGNSGSSSGNEGGNAGNGNTSGGPGDAENTPSTGDSSATILWTIILGFSAAAFVFPALRLKKAKQTH